MYETACNIRWASRWWGLALICLVGTTLLLPGCRIWRDFGEEYPRPAPTDERDGDSSVDAPTDDTSPGDGGEVAVDTDDGDTDGRDTASRDTDDATDGGDPCRAADAGAATVELQGDSASRTETICAGQPLWFEVDPRVGDKLLVSADYETDSALLAADLFADRPSGSSTDLSPVEYPIWDDDGVRLEELVTRSDPLFIRLTLPETDPDTEHLEVHLEVTTETHADDVRWLEPSENDSGDGTVSNPWTSWSEAIDALEPGDMLVTRPGMWTETGNCPSPYSNCVPFEESPEIDCDAGAADGTADQPITVAAERERRTGLFGDGDGPAFAIENCEHWEIRGLRIRSADQRVDTRGDVVIVNDSQNVLVRRLLASHPNRRRNSSVLRIRHSTDTEIDQVELYRFHGAALSISETTSSTIRGLYAHSRGYVDLGDGHGDTTRGNQGVNIWQGEANTTTHSIVEDVHQAYKVIAPGPESGLSVGDDNHFLGTAARDARHGLFIATSDNCGSASDPGCVPEDNYIEHAVMVDVDYSFVLRAGRNNRITRSSSFSAGRDGFSIQAAGPNVSDYPPSTGLTIDRSLAEQPTDTGFQVDDKVEDWTVEHVNVHGTDSSYDLEPLPDSAHERDPELGPCRVAVPEDSPAATIDGEPIGAEMAYRYDGRSRTDDKIWDQRDGRFACGAVVPGGINDKFGKSCRDVHERFNVGVADCAIP